MRSAYHHLAFTGTKKGITPQQSKTLERELLRLRDTGFLWMHNGDCVGADFEAAKLWYKMKGRIMLHPPINEAYRAEFPHPSIVCQALAYLDRDENMVELSEVLVACPGGYAEEMRGSGTWATVRYARKWKLERLIIFPDGSIGRDK